MQELERLVEQGKFPTFQQGGAEYVGIPKEQLMDLLTNAAMRGAFKTKVLLSKEINNLASAVHGHDKYLYAESLMDVNLTKYFLGFETQMDIAKRLAESLYTPEEAKMFTTFADRLFKELAAKPLA